MGVDDIIAQEYGVMPNGQSPSQPEQPEQRTAGGTLSGDTALIINTPSGRTREVTTTEVIIALLIINTLLLAYIAVNQ